MATLGNNLNIGHLNGSAQSLVLPAASRDKHLYIAGATGTGKSKFLEHLIRQDILANRTTGCGMLVIDPHGSLYDNLISWMAMKNLHRKVVLIDMRSADWVVGYNVLRQRVHGNPSVIVENFVQAMAHVWGQTDTSETPLFARWASNILRALYEQNLTLADAIYLLDTNARVRGELTKGVIEPLTKQDWDRAREMKPDTYDDKVGSTVNRLRPFLANEVLRSMFGQTTASLDLGAAIDEGAIILVSLAREKGRVSKEDSDLFATLLLTDLWTAAQERGKRKNLKPFYVYLDEFQRFVTPTIAENLDEARGYSLCLTLAHQFPKQLIDSGPHGRRVYNSVMENASSKVVFRLTDPENLEPLAKTLFMGVLNPDDIKLKLSTTKVMAYKEEYRTSYSESHMSACAYAEHGSMSEGSGQGRSESLDLDEDVLGYGASHSDTFSRTAGETYSSQEAVTRGTTRTPVLIPVMGHELSHVQFRSLEEQVHRAMVSLFDQEQRHFTTRLVGMKVPASVMTPRVDDALIQEWRVKEYIHKQMENTACALPASLALKQLREREKEFNERIARGMGSVEPTTIRRRVK